MLETPKINFALSKGINTFCDGKGPPEAPAGPFPVNGHSLRSRRPCMPPSTASAVPVVPDDSGLAR